MENKFKLKLYKHDICFGVGDSEEVDRILNQLKIHSVINVYRLVVRNNNDYLKDAFTLKIFKNDEIIEEREAYLSSYRLSTLENTIFLENSTIITRKG